MKVKLLPPVAVMCIALIVLSSPCEANAQQTNQTKSAGMNRQTDFKFPLENKLQRFEVACGKEEKFKEWMDYLRRERVVAIAKLDSNFWAKIIHLKS